MAVLKRHLTPLSKRGRISVQRGKGSTSQRTSRGQQEDVTGGNPLDRMTNRYPAEPLPAPPPTSAPSLGGPPLPAAPATSVGPPEPGAEGGGPPRIV